MEAGSFSVDVQLAVHSKLITDDPAYIGSDMYVPVQRVKVSGDPHIVCRAHCNGSG